MSRLQPQCMVSGRLGNDRGDFAVMADNAYPDYKIGVPCRHRPRFSTRHGVIALGRNGEVWIKRLMRSYVV